MRFGAYAGINLRVTDDAIRHPLASMWPGAYAGINSSSNSVGRIMVLQASMWPGAHAGINVVQLPAAVAAQATLQ